MKRMKNRVLAGVAMLGLLMAAGSAWANNLQVTNVTVSGIDASTALVKFDISWENSWRYTNINHDAAWVFFKVLPQGQTDWKHVTLEGSGVNPTGCSTGTGTGIELVVPSDRIGLFVRRAAEGAGTTSVQNVQAVWNFASNSLSKTDKVKVQAFGVEMVYVAEGAFKVGSGGTGSGELYEGGVGTSPFAITNAGPIPCSNLVGCLWGASTSGANSMGGNGTISSNFPNGYASFYCMKYEVTEGQWVDFVNTLTAAQKTERDITSSLNGGKNTDGVYYRNTVAWTNVNNDATTTARDRACFVVSWADGCAFADWAGLRPMTELEVEKACRGPLTPVADEYAWGNATITANLASETGDGLGTSTANPANANCLTSGGQVGPCRVGIYAKSSTTREQAGASYWGIMELSGNLWERTVTVGELTKGRLFTGLHGNGELNATGDADVTGWPGTDAIGAGCRGGGAFDPSAYARVSARIRAASVYTGRNNSDYSGCTRGVRAAPSGVGP